MSKVIDIPTWLKSVGRELRTGETRSAVLRRRYGTDRADLWDALTDPVRVARWFARIEGTIAPGETVVIHDNGVPVSWTSEIKACDPPSRFVISWRFNQNGAMPGFDHDDASDEVEVRLLPDGDGTVLELEQRSVDPRPWARGAGMGWEGILMGLTGHLEDLDVQPVFASGEIWPRLQAAWEDV